MGSMGSPKSSTPYDSYRDCAKGICNIYCSQWCNYPPPLDTGDDSGTSFSPLIIAVIGILASAILLVCYYAIITKYCRRRRGFNFIRRNHRLLQHHNTVIESDQLHLDHNNQDQWQVNSNGGLDDGLIKSITVFQFKKDVGLIEGTECSVCLNEFQENENLRLLPKCCHAFHPSCIDIWLKSHSNCPLCRANAVPIFPPPPPPPPPPAAASESSSTLNISAMETQRPNDLVFVIDEEELIDNQEVCVNNGFSDLENLSIIRNKKILDQDGSRDDDFRRTRNGLMIADVLQMNDEEEEEDEIKVEIQHKLEMKIMSSSKSVKEEQSK